MQKQKKNPRQQKRRKQRKEEQEFESTTVSIDRVARMMAGGRRFRFRTLVVVGNRKGKVGIGTGKGNGVPDAIDKATRRAHKNVFQIPLEGGTIPREVHVKQGASEILMRPARPGRGVIAGGVVRTICKFAGISDISAKIISRSTNDIANAKATVAGLKRLSRRVKMAEERTGNARGQVSKRESKENKTSEESKKSKE